MPEKDASVDEIMLLWQGANLIAKIWERRPPWMSDDELATLRLLEAEIVRIQRQRVARQQARIDAKRKKRAQLVKEAQRGDRRVRELLERSTNRDHTNGTA